MIYKELGNTGVKVPAIVQGTTGIGSYKNFDLDAVKERVAVLKYGIDLGMNFLDTAALYGGGFVEEVVSEVIAGIRDKVFLSTKFYPRADVRESIKFSIESSLRRLKTDYVDLYQIHWPNPLASISQTMEVLAELIKDGKVRFAGVCNFLIQDFKTAQSVFGYKLVSNQLEYNLIDRSVEDDFIPYSVDNEVTLFAYSVLNQGNILFNDEQERVLSSIAEKYGRTIPQVILRWIVAHEPVVVITKTRGMIHTKENAFSADFNLIEEDFLKISNLSKRNFVEIPTASICLRVQTDRQVYASLEEAIENKLDLIPSPVNLAGIVKDYKIIKPIRVRARTDDSGKYSYEIDRYDIMDQVKRYWAWIIAFGYDAPIPAFVLRH